MIIDKTMPVSHDVRKNLQSFEGRRFALAFLVMYCRHMMACHFSLRDIISRISMAHAYFISGARRAQSLFLKKKPRDASRAAILPLRRREIYFAMIFDISPDEFFSNAARSRAYRHDAHDVSPQAEIRKMKQPLSRRDT